MSFSPFIMLPTLFGVLGHIGLCFLLLDKWESLELVTLALALALALALTLALTLAFTLILIPTPTRPTTANPSRSPT